MCLPKISSVQVKRGIAYAEISSAQMEAAICGSLRSHELVLPRESHSLRHYDRLCCFD